MANCGDLERFSENLEGGRLGDNFSLDAGRREKKIDEGFVLLRTNTSNRCEPTCRLMFHRSVDSVAAANKAVDDAFRLIVRVDS